MAYCKRCVCGYLNVYEKAGGAPLRCKKDNRPLFGITEELYEGQPAFIEPKAATRFKIDEPEKKKEGESEPAADTGKNEDEEKKNTEGKPEEKPAAQYFLVAPDGRRFPITEPVIVGRIGLGREYLMQFNDVSREHFKITPRSSGISAVLEDQSSFGTYLNGARVEKFVPVSITNGSQLRLASKATFIFVISEGNSDA